MSWTPSRTPGWIGGAVLVLAACAAPGQGVRTQDIDLDIVSRDLVFTLAQIETLKPIVTTVQLAEPGSELGEQVVERLRDAGYGLQRVTADQGFNLLRYRSTLTRTEIGEHRSVRVSIGATSVTRDYALVDGATVPISGQRVAGVPQQSVELLAGLFDPQPQAAMQRIVFTTPTFADSAEPVYRQVASSGTPVEQADGEEPFANRVRRNMYETLRSNYASVFEPYDDVKHTILVFPNDSLLLGEANKRTIEAYARSMNLTTDVLSVIGCSHGRTALEDGNAVLANGRAQRVKEAFLFAGIPSALVLEEGCWAGEHFDEMMPRRGVVLTHKRR